MDQSFDVAMQTAQFLWEGQIYDNGCAPNTAWGT